MNIFEIAVLGLATWRISHMMLHENGPWRILRRLRVLLGVRYYDEEDNDVASAKYEITTCLWCLSVWVGIVLTAMWMYATTAAMVVTMPFALSGVAVLIEVYRAHK